MVYTIAFKIHIYISAITLIGGITTLILAIRGWVKEREYSGADKWASTIFNIGLYFQLIL